VCIAETQLKILAIRNKNMLHFLGELPQKVCVATSGGSDSMAVLHFLTHDRKRDVTVAHFNHGTEHGKEAHRFVADYCDANKIPLTIGEIRRREKLKTESPEEYWRKARYEFLDGLAEFRPVITCHTLDDVAETWLFSALNGQPKLIPYKRNNIIRPFLTTEKTELTQWNKRHGVSWIEDPSNQDTKFQRNFIRKEMMPKALHVNPGLLKLLRKKLYDAFDAMNAIEHGVFQ